MGAGIAQVAAQTGHSVTLVDLDQDLLKNSHARIQQSLQRVAKREYKQNKDMGEKFLADCLANLSTSTDQEVQLYDSMQQYLIARVFHDLEG